jgi:CTP synthase
VPLSLEAAGLGDWLVKQLSLQPQQDAKSGLANWLRLVEEARRQKPIVEIGIVGKYVELEDAYLSVKEAVVHAALSLGYDAKILWINSEELEHGRGLEKLQQIDGLVVPGGFGYRGVEGKIVAARYARTQHLPYLGLCLGMQVMCIELARDLYESDESNSTEFDHQTRYPIIDLMLEQRNIVNLGGTMRLGLYPCRLQPGTHAAEAYHRAGASDEVQERHRHRFEFNNRFRKEMQEHGMIFSGLSPDETLVEIAELRDHPFMVGTQFHPEFKSRPTRPHPLFTAFIGAAIAHQSNGAT